MSLFSILLVVLVTLMHGMSREIHRIIGRFKRKSIVEIIRLKDGFKEVGIEGEKMRLSSKWLRSPSIALLKMPSLSLSRCPSKGLDLRCFLRYPFLGRFRLYALKGLLLSRKFKLILKWISKGRIFSSLRWFWSTTSLGWIAESWDWNVWKSAIETSFPHLGDDSFSISRIFYED